jgi:hypothetical protein
MITGFLERRPGLGIFASIAGFAGSLVSFLQTMSVFIGFVGAIFGLLAGFYTYRIQRRRWDAIDRATRQQNDRDDRTTRQENEAEDRKQRNSQP